MSDQMFYLVFFFVSVVFVINLYKFCKPGGSGYAGSLFYGYFIAIGSFLFSSLFVSYDIAPGRYNFVFVFYILLFIVDYYCVNKRQKIVSNHGLNFSPPNILVYSGVAFILVLPVLHLIIAKDVPLFHYITSDFSYLKYRESFGKNLDVPNYVKYLPNYMLSFVGPLIVSIYFYRKQFLIASLLFLYLFAYATLSAAVLPSIILFISTATSLFALRNINGKIIIVVLMVLGLVVAVYESIQLNRWYMSETMEEGARVELRYRQTHDAHTPIFTDLHRLSCQIPYEFKSVVPHWIGFKNLQDILFNKFCAIDKNANKSDECSSDASCASNKCRLALNGQAVCVPSKFDCAIDKDNFVTIGQDVLYRGEQPLCEKGVPIEEVPRPNFITQRISGALYRLYFVPPDVGFSWFFFSESHKIEKIDFSSLYNKFKMRANEVGRWSYYDRFPTRYLDSVAAYGSFELDLIYLFGPFTLIFSVLSYFIIRFSLIGMPKVIYLLANSIIGTLIWQSGFYSIMFSHGLLLLILIGFSVNFLNKLYMPHDCSD